MRRIGVFARVPEPGKVKTRLSPALPPALANDLYLGMLGDTLEAAADCRADERALYWAAASAAGAFDPPRGFEIREQWGADVGERLARAMDDLLSNPTDRGVILGADCPLLDARGLEDAFAALENHDLVLGPTRDGGYYLVGLKRSAPALFRGIDWSSARVLGQTLDRAAAAGLTVSLLDVLEDVDTPEDLVRCVVRLAMERGGAPHTRAALRAMGLLAA